MKGYYGRNDGIEIDTIKDSDNEICIAIDDQRDYCKGYITKQDAIEIIKHLQSVFDINT